MSEAEVTDETAAVDKYPTTGGTPCGHPWSVQTVTVGCCRLDQGHTGPHEVVVLSGGDLR